MFHHIPSSALVKSPRGTIKFEGAPYGGAVSMFIMDSPPGHGSMLHRHPYSETWVVRKGEAEFSVDGKTARGKAGDIVVSPANVWHSFTNTGSENLELICIHPAGRMEQENWEDHVVTAAGAA